jgi:hypothetical protein
MSDTQNIIVTTMVMMWARRWLPQMKPDHVRYVHISNNFNYPAAAQPIKNIVRP